MKDFKEGLKQEMKLMKQEVDMLPKDQRKDQLRRRREQMEIDQAEKVSNWYFFVLVTLIVCNS